jgi:hypothetical protein
MQTRRIVKENPPHPARPAAKSLHHTNPSQERLAYILQHEGMRPPSQIQAADLVSLQQTAGNQAVVQAAEENEGLLSSLGGAASDFFSGGGLMHQASQAAGGLMESLSNSDINWGEMGSQALQVLEGGEGGGLMGIIGERVRGLFG